ncbi:MAG: 50S ribosomal protein L18 [Lentisphaeria bacterium]|nr:50S ribosomal protein L18 [Lentisphaeria bacterium]
MIRTTKMRRVLRHLRLRKKISGTAARPRMCVSLTANNMYVQFIDDEAGCTLAAVSTLSPEFKALNLKRNVEAAAALGKLAGEKAVAASINTVVFDRGGFQYHGRVKALADAAREAGLKF